MADPGSEARIAQLEQRWRREPGSRIFLQLAEELRRVGRLSRAIEILREGLVLHPSYPAALVALGRVLLEHGEPSEAADVLERALAQDPTQLVATKLAVEAHLQNRSSAEARARLDLYRLFNDRDDEIADLDRRLDELEAGAAHRPAARERPGLEAPDAAAPSTPDPALATPQRPAAEEPFDWSVALEAPELAFTPAPRPGAAREASPFGAWSVSEAETRFAAACRREGIFPFAMAQAAVAAEPAPGPSERPAPPLESWSIAAPEIAVPPAPEMVPGAARETEVTPEPAPETARELELAPEPAPEAVAPSVALELPEAPAEAPATPVAPALVEAPAAAPAPPPWGARTRMEELEREESVFTTPFSPREIGAEVERETIEEPFDEVFAAAPAPPRLPEVAAGPPASATLGKLYLEQGHLEEAERTYRAVLEVRPDDIAAARGLEEVVRRRVAVENEETESGWGGRVAGVAPARPLGSLTQRKIEALRAYLRKVRTGARTRVS